MRQKNLNQFCHFYSSDALFKWVAFWFSCSFSTNARYPHCLYFLELLQNANFRNAMAHPTNKVNSDIFLSFYKIIISPRFHIRVLMWYTILYQFLFKSPWEIFLLQIVWIETKIDRYGFCVILLNSNNLFIPKLWKIRIYLILSLMYLSYLMSLIGSLFAWLITYVVVSCQINCILSLRISLLCVSWIDQKLSLL